MNSRNLLPNVSNTALFLGFDLSLLIFWDWCYSQAHISIEYPWVFWILHTLLALPDNCWRECDMRVLCPFQWQRLSAWLPVAFSIHLTPWSFWEPRSHRFLADAHLIKSRRGESLGLDHYCYYIGKDNPIQVAHPENEELDLELDGHWWCGLSVRHDPCRR